MGRTCGEPNEIKTNPHPDYVAALLREQVINFGAGGRTMLKKGDNPYWTTGPLKQARHDHRSFNLTPMAHQFESFWLSTRTPHGAYVW